MEWYKKIWSPKSLVVVFLHLEGEHPVFSALKYSKKQETSAIEDAQAFDTLDELVRFYGKSLPYHVHVSGTGVLSRKIANAPNFKEDLIINSNVDEFIFTTYNDENSIVASFFRSVVTEPYLEVLSALKVHLVGISSGDVPLFLLLEENDRFAFEYTLSKKEGLIESFERNEKPLPRSMYQQSYFSKPQLLAIALYSNWTNTDPKYQTSADVTYKTAKENFTNYLQFRFYGVFVLSFLFAALVGNYFYQNHLNNTVASLELELSISNDNLALLDRLEQEKSRKLQLVQNAGVNSSRFLSFYLDEIGRTTPSKINLTNLELYPITGKLKNKHRVEVDNTSIIVDGVTSDNEVLDDWIEKLDEFDWVKSIELLNYLKNEEGRAAFKYIITLNE